MNVPTVASPDVAGAPFILALFLSIVNVFPSLALNHPFSNSPQDNCIGVDDIGGCLFERRPQPFGTTKLA